MLLTELSFILKKIISAILYPLGTSIVLMTVGVVFSLIRPRSRKGTLLIAVGLAYLVIMSLPVTSYLMLKPLETWAGDYAAPEALAQAGVGCIVVMAGSTVDSQMPPADRWGGATLLRVMEGIRLFKGVPNCRLALSGGSFQERKSSVQAMEELPLSLGVARDALVLETRASDTEDEARLFRGLVGNSPFALVTSAVHMPRSLNFFRALGTNPIPCPCDFKTQRSMHFYIWFVPSAATLTDSTEAVHEYLGIVWQKLKGYGRCAGPFR